MKSNKSKKTNNLKRKFSDVSELRPKKKLTISEKDLLDKTKRPKLKTVNLFQLIDIYLINIDDAHPKDTSITNMIITNDCESCLKSIQDNYNIIMENPFTKLFNFANNKRTYISPTRKILYVDELSQDDIIVHIWYHLLIIHKYLVEINNEIQNIKNLQRFIYDNYNNEEVFEKPDNMLKIISQLSLMIFNISRKFDYEYKNNSKQSRKSSIVEKFDVTTRELVISKLYSESHDEYYSNYAEIKDEIINYNI